MELAGEFAAQFFGINKTGILGQDPTPWDDEFEVELLRPPALGVASYVSFIEAAIFHKPSKTLLATAPVVSACRRTFRIVFRIEIWKRAATTTTSRSAL